MKPYRNYIWEYIKDLFKHFSDTYGKISFFISVVFIVLSLTSNIPFELTIFVLILSFLAANFRSWLGLKKRLDEIENNKNEYRVEKHSFIRFSCTEQINTLKNVKNKADDKIKNFSSSRTPHEALAKAFASFNNILGAATIEDWKRYRDSLSEYEKDLNKFKAFIENVYSFDLLLVPKDFDENVKIKIHTNSNDAVFYDNKHDFPVDVPIMPSEPASKIERITDYSRGVTSLHAGGITRNLHSPSDPDYDIGKNKIEIYLQNVNGEEERSLYMPYIYSKADKFSLDISIYSKNRGKKPQRIPLQLNRNETESIDFNFEDY